MRQERVLSFSVCLMVFLLGFEASGFQLLFRMIGESINLDGLQRGVLVSAQYAAIIIMPLAIGSIADRFVMNRIIAIFGFVFSFGCILVSTTSNFYVLTTGFFIIGCGYSVTESLSVTMFTQLYREKASKYINISQGAFCLGAVMSPLLLSNLLKIEGFSWPKFFLLTGICFLIPSTTILVSRMSKFNPKGINLHVIKNGRTSLNMMMTTMMMAMMLYASTEVGISYYLESLSNELFGTTVVSARLLSIFWLAMIPSRLLSGVLHKFRAQMLSLSFFASSLTLIVLVFSKKLLWLTLAVAISGFALGPIWPNLMSLTTEDSRKPSQTAGIMSTGSGIGAVMMPVILSYVTSSFSIFHAFSIILLFSIIGGILSSVGVNMHRQSQNIVTRS